MFRALFAYFLVIVLCGSTTADLITGLFDFNLKLPDGVTPAPDGTPLESQTVEYDQGGVSFDAVLTISSNTANVTPVVTGFSQFLGADSNGADASTDIDFAGEDLTLSIALADLSLPANTVLTGLSFTTIFLQNGNGAAESGTFSINPDFTWLDANDFTGNAPPFPPGSHFPDPNLPDPINLGFPVFDLRAMNGGNPVTTFEHSFVSGGYRFNDLSFEVTSTVIPEPSSLAFLGAALALALFGVKMRTAFPNAVTLFWRR